MKRARTYGWSPEQLARINARREARGQEAYIDKRFSDQDYAKRYTGESESYAAKKNKPAMSRPVGDGMEEMSLKDRQAKRTADFRKQFSPDGSMNAESKARTADFRKNFNQSPSSLNQPSSMESRRAIADEEFRRKMGRGAKGISTPMTKSAMDRVMGTA